MGGVRGGVYGCGEERCERGGVRGVASACLKWYATRCTICCRPFFACRAHSSSRLRCTAARCSTSACAAARAACTAAAALLRRPSRSVRRCCATRRVFSVCAACSSKRDSRFCLDVAALRSRAAAT